ncbi:hypothetical protein CG709_02865, partial [Lachnotalea glycerini]
MLDNPRDRFIKLEAIRVKYGLSKEQMTNLLGRDNGAAGTKTKRTPPKKKRGEGKKKRGKKKKTGGRGDG